MAIFLNRARTVQNEANLSVLASRVNNLEMQEI
jgi:hypothetical protein